MSQKLELYSDSKMLIRTTSPDTLIDLTSGSYMVTDDLREQLLNLWMMDEYGDNLILEVTNG